MNETIIHPQLLDPRRAYEVRRYHTHPHIRNQSVGEHSAQLWRILRAIWPTAPAHVLDHAMTHDIGEVAVGDVPYPTKKRNPVLAEMLDKMEQETHLMLCLPWNFPSPSKLTTEEYAIFKLAEYIEMWEYGLGELTLGNQGARLIAERMHEQIINSAAPTSPIHIPDSIKNEAQRYVAQRCKYYEEMTRKPIP